MLWANRNGLAYVLDRVTGEFLLGKPFVKVNWMDGFDPKGRPQRVPGKVPTKEGSMVMPTVLGATNWAPPSYSPRTGLFYVGAWENTGTVLTEGLSPAGRGTQPDGAVDAHGERESAGRRLRVVRALDPQTLEKKWEFPMNDITWGGVLTTAGDVLFRRREGRLLLRARRAHRRAALEDRARRTDQQRAHELLGQRPAVRDGGRRHRTLHLRVAPVGAAFGWPVQEETDHDVSAVGSAVIAVVLTAQLGAQSAPRVRSHDGRAPASFSPPRTSDGHPDMQGYWTNGTYTPLERPAEFGTKEFLTPEEARAYAKRRDDQLRAQPRDNIHYDDAIWQSERDVKGLSSLRTSLIYDPPDGKIPPMTRKGRSAPTRAPPRAS
jgi:hypothetical protein